ncbi:hypothetical protein MMC18_006298 [Xylographa bjoerkii]|nr:hypothetical protein [Xylographa bjoerkii]
MADAMPDELRKSKRYYKEERQHRFRAFEFRMSMRITSMVPDAQTIVMSPFGAEETVAKPLAELTPWECASFCFRDCALYVHGDHDDDANSDTNMSELFNAVYREWYPHRQTLLDTDQGVFFCSPVVSLCPGRPLEELVRFHRALCGRVAEQVPFIKRTMMGGRGKGVPCLPFELWPTFPAVFVVTNAVKWKREEGGVLVVCEGEEMARALGLQVEKATSTLKPAGEENESWLGFSMTLIDAMHAIVSRDEERRKARDMDSKFYVENYAPEEQATANLSLDG